jgi:hypothetical protein
MGWFDGAAERGEAGGEEGAHGAEVEVAGVVDCAESVGDGAWYELDLRGRGWGQHSSSTVQAEAVQSAKTPGKVALKCQTMIDSESRVQSRLHCMVTSWIVPVLPKACSSFQPPDCS